MSVCLQAEKAKEQADAKGGDCTESYEIVVDQVLLNAKNPPTNVVSDVFKTMLCPRTIGPFTVVNKKSIAYTLNLSRKLRLHPLVYVDLLKPHWDPSSVDRAAQELKQVACHALLHPQQDVPLAFQASLVLLESP